MRNYVWTKGSTPPEIRILDRLRAEYGPLDPSACWIWPGAIAKDYGIIRVGSRSNGTRRNVGTHIVMCEAAYGPKPTPAHEVDHHCRQPLCCNPRCLEWVTHQVNMDRKPPELVEKQVVAMLAARGIARM